MAGLCAVAVALPLGAVKSRLWRRKGVCGAQTAEREDLPAALRRPPPETLTPDHLKHLSRWAG